mgnify:CR=1 FL=1
MNDQNIVLQLSLCKLNDLVDLSGGILEYVQLGMYLSLYELNDVNLSIDLSLGDSEDVSNAYSIGHLHDVNMAKSPD